MKSGYVRGGECDAERLFLIDGEMSICFIPRRNQDEEGGTFIDLQYRKLLVKGQQLESQDIPVPIRGQFQVFYGDSVIMHLFNKRSTHVFISLY